MVVDLTMRSGSTGVACKKLNRKFIGIELDETYFNIAKERIENTTVYVYEITPYAVIEEACNRVISGYSLNEKIHHDNIHIVNELKCEHNF